MNQIEKAIKASFVAEISEAELACRLREAAERTERPSGLTAEQALDDIEWPERDAWRRAARAAMAYWQECIKKGRQTS